MSFALRAIGGALLLAATAAEAAPPTPVQPAGPPSDGALAAALGALVRGNVLASARQDLTEGDVALLAAVQPHGQPQVSFVLAILGAGADGAFGVVGRDEIASGAARGTPIVSLSREPAVAARSLGATVGWRAPDGSIEERLLVYRVGDRRPSQLLDLGPIRRPPPGTPGPGVAWEVEPLPTATGGFKDLRVRTRTVECASAGACAERVEGHSFTFDGVRYAERPFAIPFLDAITASTTLAERGALNDRSAGAAVDGRPDTAWCEGAKGAGWFEKLELTFSPAQRPKALTVLPGAGAAEFGERNRPKRIRILLPDGRKVEGELADEPRVQRIPIPTGERIFGMTVVIVDVYKGRRDDACIAELDVEVEP
jgi:hypothetical protein